MGKATVDQEHSSLKNPNMGMVQTSGYPVNTQTSRSKFKGKGVTIPQRYLGIRPTAIRANQLFRSRTEVSFDGSTPRVGGFSSSLGSAALRGSAVAWRRGQWPGSAKQQLNRKLHHKARPRNKHVLNLRHTVAFNYPQKERKPNPNQTSIFHPHPKSVCFILASPPCCVFHWL